MSGMLNSWLLCKPLNSLCYSNLFSSAFELPPVLVPVRARQELDPGLIEKRPWGFETMDRWQAIRAFLYVGTHCQHYTVRVKPYSGLADYPSGRCNHPSSVDGSYTFVLDLTAGFAVAACNSRREISILHRCIFFCRFAYFFRNSGVGRKAPFSYAERDLPFWCFRTSPSRRARPVAVGKAWAAPPLGESSPVLEGRRGRRELV